MLAKAKQLLEMIDEEYTKAVIDDSYDLDEFVKLSNLKRTLLTYIYNITEEDF